MLWDWGGLLLPPPFNRERTGLSPLILQVGKAKPPPHPPGDHPASQQPPRILLPAPRLPFPTRDIGALSHGGTRAPHAPERSPKILWGQGCREAKAGAEKGTHYCWVLINEGIWSMELCDGLDHPERPEPLTPVGTWGLLGWPWVRMGWVMGEHLGDGSDARKVNLVVGLNQHRNLIVHLQNLGPLGP